MLIRNHKRTLTVNLDRFDYVRANGLSVVAGSGLCNIEIAKCATEMGANLLEQAIFEAWLRPAGGFVVDRWCAEHNLTFE